MPYDLKELENIIEKVAMLSFFLFSPPSFLNNSVQKRLGGVEQGDVCSRGGAGGATVAPAARAEWVGRVVTQHRVLQENRRLVT